MKFPEIDRAEHGQIMPSGSKQFTEYAASVWAERRSRAAWAKALVKKLNEHLDGCPTGYAKSAFDGEKIELCPVCPVIRELLKQARIDGK